MLSHLVLELRARVRPDRRPERRVLCSAKMSTKLTKTHTQKRRMTDLAHENTLKKQMKQNNGPRRGARPVLGGTARPIRHPAPGATLTPPAPRRGTCTPLRSSCSQGPASAQGNAGARSRTSTSYSHGLKNTQDTQATSQVLLFSKQPPSERNSSL